DYYCYSYTTTSTWVF
nr:immunoglobulin light chain junction region [Macaca mulatta]